MTSTNRPLSPHLQVYRPQITSVLSILHRITGVFLSLGSVLLVAWLVSLAFFPHFYGVLLQSLRAPFGQLALLSWAFFFFYHLSNGIRHLFWDAGKGFEMKNVRRSGICVIIAALLMTGVVGISMPITKTLFSITPQEQGVTPDTAVSDKSSTGRE